MEAKKDTKETENSFSENQDSQKLGCWSFKKNFFRFSSVLVKYKLCSMHSLRTPCPKLLHVCCLLYYFLFFMKVLEGARMK